MTPHLPAPVSRRQFLLGGSLAAGAVVLGACGGGGDEARATATSSTVGGLALAQFFGGPPMLAAGAEVRAPFGVADSVGLLPVDRAPATLTLTVLGPSGEVVADGLEVARRSTGLPRAYYPLRFTVADPGIYTGRTEIDGEVLEMAIKVDAADDVTVIQAGAPMPPLATPTVEDPRGVVPVCTNDPVCALHDVTVAAALDRAQPLALLISTPAFCQVAICGPVLDVLLAAVDSHPSVTFLHAEVFAHPEVNLDDRAPVVDELGLTFEPCLVLVGSDGRVADRLDTIYDGTELDEVLARLT